MRGEVMRAVERRRRWTDTEKFAVVGEVGRHGAAGITICGVRNCLGCPVGNLFLQSVLGLFHLAGSVMPSIDLHSQYSRPRSGSIFGDRRCCSDRASPPAIRMPWSASCRAASRPESGGAISSAKISEEMATFS